MNLLSPARLTIVHAIFSSRVAGAERHALDLSAAQASTGHAVHIVGTATTRIRHAVPKGVEFHSLPLPIFRGARLNALLSRLGADICHAHLGPASKSATKCKDVMRLATLHVGYKRHHHALLDGVICVNRSQWHSISGFPGPARVIYNWPPERPSNLFFPAKGIRQELGLLESQVLVGTVARLHPSKGVDLLVRAFVEHAPTHAVLVVIGEGKQRAQLERLARGDPRVHFLGFRDDVEWALEGMDLFVSPSREEALPLAVLEAMRAGLPIVATRTTGLMQLLSDQLATLVPIEDMTSLGVAIRATVREIDAKGSQPGIRRRVHYDMSFYDRAEAVSRIEGFYRALLDEKGRPKEGRVHRPNVAEHHV